MLKTKAPRGTVDILPDEVIWWHHLRRVAEEVCRDYGYSEIVTPAFEHTELFVHTSGETSDIVTRQMYSFTDGSGRSLTLRPEGTPGVGRAYLEHKLYANPQPTRLFYFGPMFRYERPQKGRQRQFHQFGVEVFGADSALADAEVILLGIEYLRRLGLSGLEMHLNSIGCAKCRPSYREALVGFLRERASTLCEDCARRLSQNPLRVLDCKNEACRASASGAPVSLEHLCAACSAHFDQLISVLKASGVPQSTNPTLVRGLDYYSRTVFEFISYKIGAQNAVFGGGRYDGLIESLGGEPTPGVGWALGLERLILVLRNEGIAAPGMAPLEAYVVTSDSTRERGFLLAEELRRAGISTEVDVMGRSFKAQMKQADRLGARYSLFLGEEEVARNEIGVRLMETGEQSSVPLAEAVGWLLANLTDLHGVNRLGK